MKINRTVLSGLFLFCAFCFQACAQTPNKEPRKITPQYTGEIDRQDMEHSNYTSRWFDAVFQSYHPEKEALQKIKDHIKDYEIITFMGTWCPDSKREIPKLYKILEEADYDMNNIKVYTLNHGKRSDEGYEKDWHITNIPTIIFLKDGQEINRYVEHPRENFTADIAKIVSGEPYKNYYER